ncbi:CheR family methyltransferase [Aliiroseovarius marinus]|uniref:CheR family methyltransferase n=1 Tax=Aliiroseovarius marinus TaxID=2500159 RepID=UPI003D7E8691
MTFERGINPARVQPQTLDDKTFQKIADIAKREAGLEISMGKKSMVLTRLAPLLRAKSLRTFQDYISLVTAPDGASELKQMISALTTNVSHFFREEHHFDHLAKAVGPRLKQRAAQGDPIRIWSAGCSNGQEPLSIAITLAEIGLTADNSDTKILATDIDQKVIQFARRATYPAQMTNGLDDTRRNRFFDVTEQGLLASAELRNMISYRELNLLHTWPMKAQFDVVFCRNVVIYFDATTQNTLWGKFAGVLRTGATMYLGHSERLSADYAHKFSTCGTTSYERAADEHSLTCQGEKR